LKATTLSWLSSITELGFQTPATHQTLVTGQDLQV
jgi:hypothetical protein